MLPIARWLMTILAASCAGCMSIEPRPPDVPGVSWSREVLVQGSTPRTLTTTRAILSGRRNLLVPRVLAESDFRYRLNLTIDQPSERHALRCEQREGGVYRCEGNGALALLELRDGCRRGLAATASGTAFTLALWRHRGVHVGFIVNEGGRPIAAIDTDHQWVRPVWIDRELSHASRVAIDTLAYVVNDMLGAEEDGGRPFLCGDLSATRRFPRPPPHPARSRLPTGRTGWWAAAARTARRRSTGSVPRQRK